MSNVEDPTPVPEAPVENTIKTAPETVEDKGWCTVTKAGRWYWECKSKASIFGIPLLHIVTLPMKPGTKKPIIATGVIAIGILAFGLLAIGTFGVGAVSISSLAFGFIAAIGNVAVATVACIGNVAIAIGWALGNVAVASRISANAGAEWA